MPFNLQSRLFTATTTTTSLASALTAASASTRCRLASGSGTIVKLGDNDSLLLSTTTTESTTATNHRTTTSTDSATTDSAKSDSSSNLVDCAAVKSISSRNTKAPNGIHCCHSFNYNCCDGFSWSDKINDTCIWYKFFIDIREKANTHGYHFIIVEYYIAIDKSSTNTECFTGWSQGHYNYQDEQCYNDECERFGTQQGVVAQSFETDSTRCYQEADRGEWNYVIDRYTNFAIISDTMIKKNNMMRLISGW